MRYPNLRYGNPEAMRAYLSGVPLKSAARMLRRDVRTVRDWLAGRRRVPWWVPELLELRHQLAVIELRRMGCLPRVPASVDMPSPVALRPSFTVRPSAATEELRVAPRHRHPYRTAKLA